MESKQVKELILQSLEHEMGGVKVYVTAVSCAVNPDLRKEWEKYLAQTRTHVTALEDIATGRVAYSLDPVCRKAEEWHSAVNVYMTCETLASEKAA